MGHAEMLLAVAGMKDAEIERVTQSLATGAWDGFPPEQRTLFAFAHRLSRAPGSIGPDDRAEVVAACGELRAFDWTWLIAWGNYMTSVADALALPLETENVFASGGS